MASESEGQGQNAAESNSTWFSDIKICRFWDKALQMFNINPMKLKHSDEMLPCCRERYILKGYRENPSGFKQCLKSVIHPTNETLNFWTHFIPLVWLFCRHKDLLEDINAHAANDFLSYPFIAYLIGCVMLLAGSSIAHLFNAMSPTLRHVCFCCDYGAISAYCVGAIVAYYYYVSPPHCHGLHPTFCMTYIPLGVIMITAAHAVCCHTRFPWIPFRYVLRTMAYTTPFILVSAPALIRLAEPTHTVTNQTGDSFSKKFCLNPLLNRQFLTMLPLSRSHVQPHHETHAMCHLAGYEFSIYYALHLMFFGIAAVFNTTKFPEKSREGKFDIVGNSHQWFHISIALGVIMQSFVIEEGLREAMARHSFATNAGHFSESNLWSTVGVMAGCMCLFSTIVICYSRSLSKLYD